MCLTTITKTTKLPKGELIVYKQFEIKKAVSLGGTAEYRLGFSNRPGNVDTGKWVKASKGKIQYPQSWSPNSYPTGFHGYKRDNKQAIYGNYVTIPVKFRKIHTVGKQGSIVYVAREMYIDQQVVKAAIFDFILRAKLT